MTEPCPCGYEGSSTNGHARHHNKWIAAVKEVEAAAKLADAIDTEVRLAALEAWAHGGPLPPLGLVAETILTRARMEEARD